MALLVTITVVVSLEGVFDGAAFPETDIFVSIAL